MSSPRRSSMYERSAGPVACTRAGPPGATGSRWPPALPAGGSCADEWRDRRRARERASDRGGGACVESSIQELGGLALDRDAAEHGGLRNPAEMTGCRAKSSTSGSRRVCRRLAPAKRGSKQARERRRRDRAAGGQGRWSRREPVAPWTAGRGAHRSTVVPAPPALIAKLPRHAPPARRHRITPLHRSVVRPGRAM